MMQDQGFTEKDWKLFRKKIVVWQEAYMKRLNKEYVELLSGEENPSTKFWRLEKRIWEDQKKAGVQVQMSRSKMIHNIICLLEEGAISLEDLEGFSEELYHDLFGLEVIRDFDGNVILTEGLVLQEEGIWKQFLGKEIVPESNSCELYFEERDIERFAQKLENLYPSTKYVNRLMTHSWGQKVLRFYDPDGNLIEVGSLI